MLEALIDGESDPDKLVALAQRGSRRRRRGCGRRCAGG